VVNLTHRYPRCPVKNVEHGKFSKGGIFIKDTLMCFFILLLPFDCFRDGSGLNALRIKMRSEAAILI